jgi:hypothetical protein
VKFYPVTINFSLQWHKYPNIKIWPLAIIAKCISLVSLLNYLRSYSWFQLTRLLRFLHQDHMFAGGHTLSSYPRPSHFQLLKVSISIIVSLKYDHLANGQISDDSATVVTWILVRWYSPKLDPWGWFRDYYILRMMYRMLLQMMMMLSEGEVYTGCLKQCPCKAPGTRLEARNCI